MQINLKKWYTDVAEFNIHTEIISYNISKSPTLEQINESV